MSTVTERDTTDKGYKTRKYGVILTDKFQKDKRYDKAKERFKRPVTKY